MALKFQTTVKTLTAATPLQLVPANPGRSYLMIQVTGTGAATIKEDSNPVVGGGISLDPPAAAGGQGGAWEPDPVPNNAYFGISGAGTTVIVVEGF